jgi:hypothetical protein
MSRLRIGACAWLLVVAMSLRAQDRPLLRPNADAELWLSIGTEVKPFKKKSGQVYEHKFYKRFRVLGELGYRGNENLTSSKLTYTVLGFNYRLLKFLRVGAEHRYNFRDRYTSNSHRMDVNARLGKELGRWAGDYRVILQHEFIPPIRYRTLVRNRLAIEYNIPKWRFDPQVTVETFTALHHTGDRLIGLRYGVGTTFPLDEKGKHHVLDLAVRHDREQNMPDLSYRWIWSLAYEYRWAR